MLVLTCLLKIPSLQVGHLLSRKSFSKFECPLPTTKQILTFQSDFRFAPFNLKIQQFANPGAADAHYRLSWAEGSVFPQQGYLGENGSLSDNVLAPGVREGRGGREKDRVVRK